MMKIGHLDRALAGEARHAKSVWLAANPLAASHACNCIGPQNGQPRCPCAMRGVVVKNGRYVVPEQDLGPVVERK